MTRLEVIELLAVFRVNYPRFGANQSDEDFSALLNLWHAALEPYPAEAVNTVALQYIAESEYPPVVASITKRISNIQRIDEASVSDCFEAIRSAAKRGYYNAAEEYAKLPPEAQDFVGSPSGLRDLSQVDDETINTVTRGQFAKQYETLHTRKQLRASIPSAIREMLAFPGLIKQLPQGD